MSYVIHRWTLLALGLLLLTTSGCQRTVSKLAKGDGLLAQDAKAVLKALARRPGREKILAVDSRNAAFTATDRHGCGVVVQGGRIVEVIARDVPVDFAALSSLGELRYLDLRRSHVSRVALARLPKLQVLELRKSKIDELRLSDLAALSKLVLLETPLETLSLARVGLASLDLRGSKLRRLEARALPKLRILTIEKTPLATLTLVDLPALELVYAAYNSLRQLEVSKLPALTHLELGYNRLKALPRLAGASKLLRVSVDGNLLTSLVGLEVLNPKELFVESNELTSVVLPPTAKQPTRLETLAAAHNKLTSLEGVGRLTGLVGLYLDHNKITSLAGIEALKKLRRLHVSYNPLKALTPLAVASLDELIATDGAIASASELFGADGQTRPKLARYDLRRNRLEGVATALLFAGVAREVARGRYPAPARPIARSVTTGYGGPRSRGSGSGGLRSTGSRYSSSGGYRSGK